MQQKIPKIIHYVWLGSDLPQKVQQIIAHNKQYTPSYQIKIWTDDNVPNMPGFAVKAREDKNWAFLSDYMRMVKLEQYGGIYLDTDQKLLRPIDDLLIHSFFAGWNREGTFVYTGIIGASANNSIIKKVIEQYEILKYDRKLTSPKIITECLKGFPQNKDIKLYSSKYFYPISADEMSSAEKLSGAYSTHLWNESWVRLRIIRKILRKLKIIRLYKRIKGYFNKLR